ncbi:hypothetical protein, partial [Burkholderia sp. SIMBA_024]|uniref:hypothetical protein n=1 Tax=Burkholderia sp. SIMBA_024 TaxID=3085768 RepID=UPI003977E4F8
LFDQEKLPFLLVQLPNFMEPKPVPSESNWAALRQQQSKVLEIPNTGMAVAIDLGEWNDIHPLNKYRGVGQAGDQPAHGHHLGQHARARREQ